MTSDSQAPVTEQELRHLAALRDVEILTALGPQDDLDDLVEWTARNLSLQD
ncbi:hypothetical protein [Kytococcus sedentarius]|uniref:hypothetical protein n=1 Tax=Kytococcus sedentarius TaxID=1276 RepID=UPI0035BC6538